MSSFPTYFQHDSMDCGPTCLRMIAKFYGKSYSLQTLRDRCHISREGVSMLGICDAAESIGFRATGVKLTWNQLKEELPLPCIVHWNHKHFVVVYSIESKNSVMVADPATGLIKYGYNEFLKSWLGTRENTYGLALILEPTPQFYQIEGDNECKYGFLQIVQYLRPYRSYIVQIILAMLTASIISMLLPFVTQAIVDSGIAIGSKSLVVMLLVAQLMLTMGGVANNLIRSWLMLHTTTRVSVSLISDFLCKLMKLPIAFFDSKMVGDIMQRIGDYNRIQTFLTGSLLSMVIAAISLVVYSIIMAGYDVVIFVVFIIGSLLYIGWVLLFMKKRRRLDSMRFQYSAANQSNIVQMVGGMQDIKLNSCERQRRWEWESIQVNLFKVSVKSLSLGQLQEIGSTFIDQTKNIFISFIAAKSVIDGDMTLGMMMALQYIVGQVSAPISQFIGFAQSAQDASISLDRLGEIYMMKDEEPDEEPRIRVIPENADIVFRNVDFQYDGPYSSKVLNNISFVIPSGKVTAIVGSSGSGKTTILKMMLGFYSPTAGDVLLGGVPLKRYSDRSWRKCCGSVMQDGYVFSDSIVGNIAISDEHPDMERVQVAANVSNISEWIDSLPLGYNTKIGSDGQGLSAGQKQRVLIARAAYKNARYLFFDEATNSLDASNERNIMRNLNGLFERKTVVIVAHRLSTVRNADNIIVLDQGRVAECGSHSQLIMQKGKYYELIKNQLELEQ